MYIRTIDGQTRTFLFEAAGEQFEQYMQETATGFRGKPYEVGPDPVELPDVVGQYAVTNVDGVEETYPIQAGTCDHKTWRGSVCGRELPCRYHNGE